MVTYKVLLLTTASMEACQQAENLSLEKALGDQSAASRPRSQKLMMESQVTHLKWKIPLTTHFSQI